MTRGDTIQTIRRLADFLEFHSDIPLPSRFSGGLHIGEQGDFKRAAKELLSHGATVEVGGFVVVSLVMGSGVSLSIQTSVNALLDDQPELDKTERVMAELEKP